MITSKIPYQELRYFSKLIKAYVGQSDDVRHLYHRYPLLENFSEQMAEKSLQPGLADNRQLLSKVLTEQYAETEDAELTRHNIALLEQKNTFTVTTGHQLNLFTGPLYFLYKIISTINLCQQLKEAYPDKNFVPVYWMATEDHDFEEIQYFNVNKRKLVYEREAKGAVGRLKLDGLKEVNEQLSILLGSSKYADELTALFDRAYSKNDLAAATRQLAHELFKKEGLVIIDADDRELKSCAIPYFKEELLQQTSYDHVSETLEHWNEDFNIQVQPREINLFYLVDDGRYRIVKNDSTYLLDGHEKQFTKESIIDELNDFPERFSPNVIMRPLYEELILPNLCYIGGGGELAYWLELKSYFESQNVVFPILLLRNSALLVNQKQLTKLDKLDLNISDLFLKPHEIEAQIAHKFSKIDIDLSEQKDHLKEQFEHLYQVALHTDPSFKGAVAAQERKQIKGLEHLEKRLLKAQKRKYKDIIDRVHLLRSDLFPHESLQERQTNFSEFYKDLGPKLIEILKDSLDPMDFNFTVINV